ncbi:hypothetical protein VPNG_08504 [Cytospora leucostoma]|uniref:ADF-H domain-containing protein n=1 Tax=Cytospora leucostoma TaxID=1230097 RepID=A0A423W537_9PEZI|nr:hypothetical protein VPNG_08504 [Cytospora leucostoma]
MSNFGPEVDAIVEAYEAVRNDKDETTWLLVTAAKGNKLSLTKTGTDKSFVSPGNTDNAITRITEELDEGEIQYGYVRVEYANDSESTRVKFVMITWMGSSAGIMRRAKVGADAGEVQQKILRHYSKELRTDDKHDLNPDAIVKELRRSGGADYNGGRG